MAWRAFRIVPDDTNINFVGFRKVALALSLLVLVASIFFFATRGLNWGIDFTGGLLMEIRTEQPADLGAMRAAFPKAQFGDASLQQFGDERDVLIRFPLSETADQAQLTLAAKESLAGAGFENVEYRKVEYVGPTVGAELKRAGTLAVVFAVLGIMAYVWFRFEWQFGMGAVLALLHDAALVLGFFIFTRYEFGLTEVAAVLTVLGYSINDTVVIYDRIRENMRKYKKMPLEELVNKSINETLARTVLTGGTTILALLALVVFGGEVLRGFAASILFGVIVGTYSSVYISAPVLLWFNLRDNEEQVALA